eukprot:Awhi_evm1s129
MTQFSYYVNANAEAFRSSFVDFDGKKELTVSTAGSLYTVDYAALARRMSNEIAKNIKEPKVRDWVCGDFTTTTDNDKVVYSVILMAQMQSYFQYKFSLSCGIPNVTLEGTTEDYIQLREKINKLLDYDLEDGLMTKWHGFLVPVLDELVSASAGNPDVDFWSRICHYSGGGSGPRYLSGWISSFSVFSARGQWQGDRLAKHDGVNQSFPLIETGDITSGLVTVPVLIDDNGKQYNSQMFAGSFASNLDVNQKGSKISPSLDWAIVLDPN